MKMKDEKFEQDEVNDAVAQRPKWIRVAHLIVSMLALLFLALITDEYILNIVPLFVIRVIGFVLIPTILFIPIDLIYHKPLSREKQNKPILFVLFYKTVDFMGERRTYDSDNSFWYPFAFYILLTMPYTNAIQEFITISVGIENSNFSSFIAFIANIATGVLILFLIYKIAVSITDYRNRNTDL